MDASPLRCTCGWTHDMLRGHTSKCVIEKTRLEILQMTPEGPKEVKARMNDSERLGYDAVNLPDHYKAFKIEPIYFCQENKLDALQTAIVKYVVRHGLKNGVEDLFKAKRCLDMLIANVQGDPDWWTMKSSEQPK